MKTIGLIAAAAFAAGLGVAYAQDIGRAEGEVRKVDKEAGKITLRHGPIEGMDMPGMTMVFQTKDKAILDSVKQGDKVRFTTAKEGGAFVLKSVEPMK